MSVIIQVLFKVVRVTYLYMTKYRHEMITWKMPLLAMSEMYNKISFKCHHIGKNNDNLQIEQQERDGTLQEM